MRRARPPSARPTTIAGERESAEIAAAFGDPLKSVRAAADSWQKGLAGLLGVVTSILLLKGADSVAKIDHDWAVAAAVVLAVAALAAMLATVQLLSAAYGMPSPSGLEEIRRKTLYVWRYEQATAAAKQLRDGQKLLLFSVFLVGATVVVMWFAPAPEASPAYQVVDDDGNCGQLEKASNGQLKIVQDDASGVLVADSELGSLTIARTCP